MEIRDHVAEAKADPCKENLETLWRAVFMLKAWYFIPAEQSEGPNRPMVVMVDERPWLAAFTNVRRYRDFGERIGRADADGEMHFLALDPLESMQKLLEIRESVVGVVFNPGSDETFRAPVEALEEYAEHFGVPLDGF